MAVGCFENVVPPFVVEPRNEERKYIIRQITFVIEAELYSLLLLDVIHMV